MRYLPACIDLLRRAYGISPGDVRVVRSPYRICPLGAHVDHQLGCVSGMPIDAGILLAFVPRSRPGVRLRSLDYPGETAFPLDRVPDRIEGDWGNYARGAARALLSSGPLTRGLDGVLAGDLPVGGLSSSSAVGVACLMALAEANGRVLSQDELISLDQYVENVYLGLQNGILDQSIIVSGRRDRLLHIDCLTRERTALERPGPAPPFSVLVAHSGVTQALVTTGYNQRVAECAEAARLLLELSGHPPRGRPRLRHVPRDAFEAFGGRLPDPLRRRAAHFFSESDRVEEGTRAWSDGDLARFGALISASGRSSIDLYECGSPPLIRLYEILHGLEGVYGTRFSGAGFRGACVALIDPSRGEEIAAKAREGYAAECPEHRDRFSVTRHGTDDGARILSAP